MDNHKVLPYSERQVMMINETILCLVVSDCSDHRFGKYPELDNRVTHDLDKHIYETLKQIFTRVIRYDFLKRYVEAGVRRINQEIIDIVKAEHPKYVLWRSRNYEIQEATFQEIRKEGATVIGWFFDDELRFENYSKWWVPYIDYFLTCDREAVKKYEELGARSLFTLVYSNPDFLKRLKMPKKYDVSFVGTNYSNRTVLVNALKKRGIMVNVFGEGWEAGHVSFDEMVNIYNASKINLSFMQSYNTNTRPQMKSRIFEICMCGGFLLCEYISGIEEFYEIDKEIVCFKDIEEAAAKIRYYLDHEVERQAIAQAGWERAQRDHSQSASLLRVFEEIEKDTKSRNRRAIDNLGQLDIPRHIRQLPSSYHLRWAKVLMMEGYDQRRWQEELDLALFYDPGNVQARRLRLIGRLPAFLRPGLIRLLAVLGRLKRALRFRLAAIPILKKTYHLASTVETRFFVRFGRLIYRDKLVPISKVLFLRKLRLAVGEDPLFPRYERVTTTGRALRNPFLASRLADIELGVWRFEASALNFLEHQVQTLRPKVVLEFGSGVSTACLARYMQELHGDSNRVYVFSIEQELSFAQETVQLLETLQVKKYARVVHSPLRQQVIEGIETTCYDLSADFLRTVLEDNRPDFVAIDGPSSEEPGTRFGTLPLVWPFLSPSAWFFLDDAFRDGELKIAQLWSRLPYVQVDGVYLTGKGLLVGQVAGGI